MHSPFPFSSKSIVVLMAVALTACGKTPEEHFVLAEQLVKKGDYRAAVIELKTVLQEQADNRDARRLLGEVFIRNEAYPQAEKELSRAKSLGAPEEDILPALATVYVRMGEPQKAIDLATPAGQMTPQSRAILHAMKAEAHLALGRRAEAASALATARQADAKQPVLLLTEAKLALVDRKRDEAVRLVDEALKADPRFLQALYLKAALREAENKTGEAAAVYQQILAADPAQFRAHLAMASLHLKKGNIESADSAVQAAERIAEKAPLVRYARARLELQRGNPEKASTALMEILRAAPDHLPSMLAYSMASYSMGNYEQSINYAGKVLNAAPNDVVAARILAGSQVRVGDNRGALKTITSALRKHPEDPALLALAGDVHLKLGDHERAMDYLDKAVALQPKNAFIKSRRAVGYLASGDRDEAVADLESAAKMSERAGQADLALVTLHLKDKQYDKALQAIAALEKKLPNNPVTHNLRAAALLGKKDHAGARKALERALAIEPKFFPAALNLARLDIQDKQPARARKRFEAILASDAGNVKAMLALASLAATQKDEKDAVAWLEKAAKADATAIEPRARLVQYFLRKQDKQKALAWAREGAKKSPDNLEALGLLGSTLMANGDYREAAEVYGRLTLKAPRSAEAQYRLALAFIGEKKTADARAALKNAVAIGNHAQAASALIRLELAEKKPDAALAVARQIQVRNPASPLGHDLEGDILVQQKHVPQAVKAYEQALTKQAGAAGLIKLHRALRLAGDAEQAEQRLQAWLKQHPQDLAVRAYAAEHFMGAGRDRDAIAQYEAVLKLAPQNALALNNLANLYRRVEDKRALTLAEASHKLAPDHPGIKDTLGWILVQEGQLPRAVELLHAAASKAPKAGNIRYHYGVALARSGRKIEAKKELEAAIASGQTFAERDDAKTLLGSL